MNTGYCNTSMITEHNSTIVSKGYNSTDMRKGYNNTCMSIGNRITGGSTEYNGTGMSKGYKRMHTLENGTNFHHWQDILSIQLNRLHFFNMLTVTKKHIIQSNTIKTLQLHHNHKSSKSSK